MNPSSAGAPWWRSAVVYQIYPRSFADADGDGIGDLRGIIGKVDYLADLGVDVVWLSPVYRSPMDDMGYDISDYQDIDPLFGSLADLDDLIAALHERGIKLLMDLVVNHTSDEHEWFRSALQSKDDPKRDWYVWRQGRDGGPPNNWTSAFSGSAWEFDPASGEYFLHLFSRRQPDLNWENPQVRQAVHAMMRWWLDRGVDGFRMDVINLISKVDGLPDGRPDDPWVGSEHFMNGPRIHEFLQEMHAEVFAGRDGNFLTVGEMPGSTIEEARLYTDPARHEVDMVFQFEHVQLDGGPGGKYDLRPLRLTELKRSLAKWQDGLADSGWNSLYWGNHDQPRSVSRFGSDGEHRVASAKLLATVLYLHRGTPYLYQGDEFGMTNFPFTSIEEFRDIEALNYYAATLAAGGRVEGVMTSLRTKSRDNARTPVQWDDSRHAGFTSGEPWLPVNPNHVEVNAAAAVADPDSVLHHVRRVFELRHELPVVADGDFTMLVPEHEQLYAFTRRLDDTELRVVANFSDTPTSAAVDGLEEWRDADTVLTNVVDGDGVTLRPWEVRVQVRTRT